MSGQSVKKLDNEQTKTLIKEAGKSAFDRQKEINNVVKISYYYTKNAIL